MTCPTCNGRHWILDVSLGDDVVYERPCPTCTADHPRMWGPVLAMVLLGIAIVLAGLAACNKYRREMEAQEVLNVH